MTRQAHGSCRLAVIAASLFATNSALAGKYDCKYLLENADELSVKGELNNEFGGLAGTLASYHVASGACVWRTEPASAPYCKETSTPRPENSVRPPPNREWNGTDFRNDILQIFVNRNNYAACRDIFEEDDVLQQALSRMPPLTRAQREKYEAMSNHTVEYGVMPAERSTAPFTETQLKMFAIFEQMPEWAYCSGDMYRAFTNGQSGRAYAWYDPNDGRVTLYNGACSPRDIYGLDISFVPSAFAGFLIAAHEVGHAIESISEGRWRGGSQSEAIATYYGTLMDECVSRRSDELFGAVKRFVEIAEKGNLPPEFESKLGPADVEYARCAVNYLTGWSKYFREVRREINLDTGEMPLNLGIMNSEIQLPQGDNTTSSAE